MQTRIKKGYKANTARGFTLAELLVILLISSIIMVVLAPVVRKKQNSNTGSNSSARSQVQSVTYTYNSTNAECSRSASDNTLKCNFKVPQGVKFLNIHMVAGGGGGGGASTPTIKSGNSLTHGASSQKNLTISEGMRNVKIAFLTGGGGGGGGGAWAQTTGDTLSQTYCDKFSAKYLTAEQNGGKAVCVTKYNIGDIPATAEDGTPGPANGGRAPSVKWMSTSKWCSEDKPLCCWGGKDGGGRTGQATNCGPGPKDYGGCYRTLCTWHAADVSCKNLAYGGTKAGDWRLPTIEELKAWSLHIDEINNSTNVTIRNNGLLLCHWSKGLGAIQCENTECCSYWGAKPYNVWSSKIDESLGYGYNYHLVTGDFIGPNGNAYGHPNSTRCVLEVKNPFSSYAGGGGGAAPYLKNYTIPQDIIEQCTGGKIVLYAGAGGNGSASGASSGSSGTAGNAGGTSYIYVYNSSNQLKWGFQVPGGNGGGRATSASAGAAGAQKAINTCKIYNGSSWQDTNCTSAGLAGEAGTSATNIIGTGGANGGRGGHSYYNTSTASGGGAGANSPNQNGTDASRNGAGGGGGGVLMIDDVIYKGTGGKGSVGVAQITYDIAYQAAAGGGGGGGAYAYVENVPVTPEKTYTVKVGGGGNGGSVNNDGIAGGATSVRYHGGTYILNGGSGGKKGTSATQSATAIQGSAGAAGTTNIPSKFTKAAQAGTNATVSNNVSIGGNGGKSGISTPGGCGGFISTSSCSNASSNGSSPAYVAPGDLYNSKNYGKAGSGGGGGGWKMTTSSDSGPGGGAVGIPGYVYIYWIKYE